MKDKYLEDKQEELQDWHKQVAKVWSKRFGFSYETGLKLIRSPLKREVWIQVIKNFYER